MGGIFASKLVMMEIDCGTMPVRRTDPLVANCGVCRRSPEALGSSAFADTVEKSGLN